jgi:hypothetical protein
VLVISDAVNPWNLTDAHLTQPGDISAALNAPNSGINLAAGGAAEVNSQCVDAALAALSGATPPNVVVYFAHQPARGCNASDQQTALTNAFENLLTSGGGIVVFHHGIYLMPGKEAMLALLGAQASGVMWDTSTGQRIFNTAPNHFVTTNGVSYTGTDQLTAANSVPSGTFDYFDNIPDERYPNTLMLPQSGETRQILFASTTGGTRVLGYSLQRPGWTGRVVTFQPGEYQPNALDNKTGNQFQILANEILYASGNAEGVGGTGGTAGGSGTGGGGGSGVGGSGAGGSGGAAGVPSNGGTTAGGAGTGGSAGAGNALHSGDDGDDDACACGVVGGGSDGMWAIGAAVAGVAAFRGRRGSGAR